jgi:hypothetical protein
LGHLDGKEKVPKIGNSIPCSQKYFETLKILLLHWEWTPMCYYGFIVRIGDFEEWLWDQEEEVVAIVGHSQSFKGHARIGFPA